jgi:hypothetical protein
MQAAANGFAPQDTASRKKAGLLACCIPGALLFFSSPAPADRWRHVVTTQDGDRWSCYPPARASDGQVLYRCYDTKKGYTYENDTPLTEESLKRARANGELFYEE